MFRRVRIGLVSLLVVLVLVSLVLGGWVLRGRYQAQREERAESDLRSKLGGEGGDAETQHRVGLDLIGHGNADEGLAHLEIAAERAPENLLYGNDLRLSCTRLGRHDRSIRFFERLS